LEVAEDVTDIVDETGAYGVARVDDEAGAVAFASDVINESEGFSATIGQPRRASSAEFWDSTGLAAQEREPGRAIWTTRSSSPTVRR
jgi:hypothetical protein